MDSIDCSIETSINYLKMFHKEFTDAKKELDKIKIDTLSAINSNLDTKIEKALNNITVKFNKNISNVLKNFSEFKNNLSSSLVTIHKDILSEVQKIDCAIKLNEEKLVIEEDENDKYIQNLKRKITSETKSTKKQKKN